MKPITIIITIIATLLAIPAACIGLSTAFYNPADLPMRPPPVWERTPTTALPSPETRLPQECSTSRMADTNTQRGIAVVEEVIDGDTLRLANRSENLRMWGIDAPESDQPGGAEAKAMLEQLTPPGELLIIEAMPDLDPYGRIVAVIGRENQQAANHRMVESGWAFHYEAYAPGNHCLWNAERQARLSQAGLWGRLDNGGLRPWEWRKRTSRE